MFMGEQFRLYRPAIREALGVIDSTRCLHELAYPNAEPSHCALVGVTF
uniref:Uncharacterized protein n=1 Tax=Arundo donax TaxID=35708 RepID=A0A0A9CCU8_ARUDO